MNLKIPYWYIIAVPALLIFFGSLSNQVVLLRNHGEFPVLLNSKQIEEMKADQKEMDEARKLFGGDSLRMSFSSVDTSVNVKSHLMDSSGDFIDDVHAVMTQGSRFKALSDIWNFGDYIYSVGDFGVLLGYMAWAVAPFLWIALIIKDYNT